MGFEELVKKTVTEAIQEAINRINIPVGEITPVVMNVKQAAKYLGVGTNWLYDNLEQLPHYDLGGTKFNKEDLDNWRLDKTGRSYRVVRK